MDRDAAVIEPTAESSAKHPINRFIAERLSEAVDLLTTQRHNPFRIAAYRKAAESLRALDRGVETILNEGGVDALDPCAVRR
jgi:DNA polymerase/3'-5' exonuclease PolX